MRTSQTSTLVTKFDVDIFTEGEFVDVTGRTKGKGFQGNIKRHGHGRGPMSHGSKYHRGVGALNSVDPARVFKGRKMPGRMGGQRRTVQNLEIVKVDARTQSAPGEGCSTWS